MTERTSADTTLEIADFFSAWFYGDQERITTIASQDAEIQRSRESALEQPVTARRESGEQNDENRTWIGLVLRDMDYVVGAESFSFGYGRGGLRHKGHGVRSFFEEIIQKGVTEIIQTTGGDVYGVLPGARKTGA